MDEELLLLLPTQETRKDRLKKELLPLAGSTFGVTIRALHRNGPPC